MRVILYATFMMLPVLAFNYLVLPELQALAGVYSRAEVTANNVVTTQKP